MVGSAVRITGSTEKVYRGGAWSYPLSGFDSAVRDWITAVSRFNTIGFRVVLNQLPPQPPGSR